ncbi:MAG: hypothetical protein E7562_05585 [Ruminococcaceae bacterium]|nr:hypothetical protein [Oscillospiraceae bacterium]
MKLFLKSFKKSAAVLLSAIIAVMCCFVPTAVSADVTAVTYDDLSDFWVRNSSASKMPTETSDGIVTSTGALKMQALDSAVTYGEKTFTDFYNIANYDIYGNKYYITGNAVNTYGASFDATANTITTADATTKLKLDGTEGMTDFETEFKVTKLSAETKSLYGGIAFRLQDSDFRTATFGTQGYMLLVVSEAESCDVKVLLRKYSTASAKEETTLTKTGLLSAATNGVKVSVKVTGKTLNFTVADAANAENTYSNSFSLVPTITAGQYYDNGSFAFVTNGHHTIEDISLKGSVPTNYVTHEKEIFNLYNRDFYDIHGNTTGDDVVDYGVKFADDRISSYSQSKVKIKGYTNVEDFKASFNLEKTNGNALYGGIAFRMQDVFFEKASFGTPGYLLFAYSAADSMDLYIRLRNYSTASGFAYKEVKFEGFLAAPDQKNIRMEVEVIGTTVNVTVYDLTDLNRKSSASISLTEGLSASAKANLFKGGSIAFVSNGTHDYTNISVKELVNEAPYTEVENFEAQADFTFPSSTNLQAGIMFYVQDTIYKSAGLTAFSVNAIRAASSADNEMTLQLVRYGRKADGTLNTNIGAVSGATYKVSSILQTVNGAGEKLRLKVKVIRGTIYYSLVNVATGKESEVFSAKTNASSTSNSVTYNTAYSSGGVGIFTNLKDVVVSDFKVTKLPDCVVTANSSEEGTVTGAGTYSYGETVTVTATPEYGYYFGGWYNGETLVTSSESYSFTATENVILTPKYIPFPLRITGLDTENGAAVINIDNIENVTEIGFEIVVKKENGDTERVVSTEYVNALSADKTPYISTASKVYYCDIDANGDADADDIAALRSGIIQSKALNTQADLNGDTAINVKDIVRFKKVMAETQLRFEGLKEGYNYPFVFGDLLSDEGNQYVELKPYTVIDGAKSYGVPRYLSFDGKILKRNSDSLNHTPFGKIRIACVGDSLTQGVGATGWASGDYQYAYPEQLNAILADDNCIVENFGVGGSYAWYYAGRGESLWYPNTAKYQPSIDFDADIVIIMLGTNDAKLVSDEEKSEQYGAALEDIANRWLAGENKPVIYICNGLTMAKYDEAKLETDTSWVTRDDKFRNFVHPQQIAVAEKLGLEFIDTYYGTKEFLENKGGLASDLLHANDAGYRALAEYISQNISLDIFY